MIKIIQERVAWNAFIQQMEVIDFYHTFEYHCLDKSRGDLPILIAFTDGIASIALPLLIRKIPGTDYFDATSVSGYAGPLGKNINSNFDNTTFREELHDILKKNKVISVFTRLSPFIPNQEISLKYYGEIAQIGQIVHIDLTQSLEDQRRGYQRRLKTYINKSRRLCTVKTENNAKGITEFSRLYYETMQRHQAASRYYFSEAYFQGLLQSESFETEIWLARENENGEVIAGALFIKKNENVHYHLSGMRVEFRHLNPIKQIIDEMRIKATNQNYSSLNLGGGVGSKTDTLFRFKKSFSKELKPFKVWRHIVDVNIYNQLVLEKRNSSNIMLNTVCREYFPLYRCSPDTKIKDLDGIEHLEKLH